MKLEGTYTFEAPRDIVWDALLDPEVLASVMPGCEKLEKTGDGEYKGTIKIKVGPVQGKFQGQVTLMDLNEPDSYRMIVNGKGAPGFMKGEGNVELEDQGTETLMHYTGEAQVGGKLASVGQRLIDTTAKAMTKQSLDNLHKQIQARAQAAVAPPQAAPKAVTGQPSPASAPAPAPVVDIEHPSEFEFALGVAKNMVEDLVPPERRPILLGAALGVLGFLLFLNWWGGVVAQKTADAIWERR